MSIPVTTDDLATKLEEYGAACFLLSVPPGGGHPKVAHVPVVWDGEVLRCTPGGGTLRNLGEGAPVTLVFPGPTRDSHSMLLDGTGRAVGEETAEIEVTGGVLHRPAPDSPGDEAHC